MNYEDNFQKQLSMMENLTNAHNALSDTVNKHIEFTTALADKVKSEDAYNSEVQCKLIFEVQRAQLDIRENTENIIKGRTVLKHIAIIYICILITMITIGWKLI